MNSVFSTQHTLKSKVFVPVCPRLKSGWKACRHILFLTASLYLTISLNDSRISFHSYNVVGPMVDYRCSRRKQRPLTRRARADPALCRGSSPSLALALSWGGAWFFGGGVREEDVKQQTTVVTTTTHHRPPQLILLVWGDGQQKLLTYETMCNNGP